MTLDNIIAFFCDRRGIAQENLFRHFKGNQESLTRYMLWHYLHTSHHYSASSLAKLFRRNIPSIFRGMRILKHQMAIYEDMRQEYNALVKEIEDESEDPSSPSDMK